MSTDILPTPQLSFLIPAWNEEEHLACALSSIHSSCAAVAFDSYEIVVCDNNSTDRTPAIAREHGAKAVFDPVNRIARARNSAARASSGKWLIFLDADTILNPGLLSGIVSNLRSGRVCGGGAQLRFEDNAVRVAKALASVWNLGAPILSLAAGGCQFCLREAWEGVSGFDETLYVSEDAMFAWSVARWGRARGLRFVTVRGSPALTSSRKFRMYGSLGVVWQLVRLSLPGARRRSGSARQWYERQARGEARVDSVFRVPADATHSRGAAGGSPSTGVAARGIMESLEDRVKRVVQEPVAVVPHDPGWPESFRLEKEHLLACLPERLIRRIEHFGSTAVPGLPSKPIVDILVEVTDLAATREQIAPILEAQGYEYFWRPTRGDDGPPFYAWFIKRDANGRRTHHIHMVEAAFREHWDRLLFRDYLIAHPEVARRYGELKFELATRHPGDRLAYARGKAAFIDEVTTRAIGDRRG